MNEEKENFKVKYYGVRLEMDELIKQKESLERQLKEREDEIFDIYKRIAKAYLHDLPRY